MAAARRRSPHERLRGERADDLLDVESHVLLALSARRADESAYS